MISLVLAGVLVSGTRSDVKPGDAAVHYHSEHPGSVIGTSGCTPSRCRLGAFGENGALDKQNADEIDYSQLQALWSAGSSSGTPSYSLGRIRKTTALQALALWDIGLRRWNEKRAGKATPEKRPGVTINRRDLIAVPVPDANLLWRDLHVRDVQRVNGGQETKNIRIDIIVDGVANDRAWTCGLEFDYANEESFYCRPLRRSEEKNPERMRVPDECSDVRVAFLPPMSGLAASETRLDPGAVNVRLGEGRTAEVLRNLCFQIVIGEHGAASWASVRDRIEALFGVVLDEPKYIAEHGEVTMAYRDPGGARLDISSSGRAANVAVARHLAVNPGSVLLREPDAHWRSSRQRQIYQRHRRRPRTIQPDHCSQPFRGDSETEAADRDVVVAFIGTPSVDDRKSV